MRILMKFRKTVMFVTKALITSAVTFAFIFMWHECYETALFSKNGNYVVVASYIIIFLTFTTLYSGFRIGILRLHELWYSLGISLVFTNFVMYLELSLIAREMLPVWPAIFGVISQIILSAIGAYCANSIYFSLYRSRHILAIFSGDKQGLDIIQKMSKIPERYSIDQAVSIKEHTISEIESEIEKYEAVLICDFDKSVKNEVLRFCYEKRKRIYLLPSSNDIIISNAYQSQVFDTPILMCRNRGLTVEQEAIKRMMDVFVSGIMLLVFSPAMIISALAIKLYDGGPVLFKQNRVTKDGKIFNVLKFRSMVVDADKKDGDKRAKNHDDRITPVGRIIRPCRLDELPQLLNILRGDMSLVGPRPERIENVYKYTEMLPEFNLRHRVKGGLTGYAQIYGKYNTSPADKLNMDLIYIENYSVFLDLKLILMTVKIMFMKESTEGFQTENEKKDVEENEF